VGWLINTHTPGTLSMDTDIYHLQSFGEVDEKCPCCIADLNNTPKPEAVAHPYCYLLCLKRNKITPSVTAQGQPNCPSFLRVRGSVSLSQAAQGI